MEQRSPEWYAARLGKVGASRIGDLMSRTKTGYGASRANLMAELICERLTGTNAEGYTNAAMQWGIEKEPDAKSLYCLLTDATIEDVGFLDHPTIHMAGCSPDGLVGDDGLVEIKCPNTATQIETLLSGAVDGKYIQQMQFQMSVTGRAWCDFASYDPRLPPEMQLWVKRVERDNVLIATIEKEVVMFLSELDAKLSKLQSLYQIAEAA